jgi:hypothetical protein
MTTFEAKCPLCGNRFQAEDEWVGEVGECPSCGKEIKIEIPEKHIPQALVPQKQHVSPISDDKICPLCGKTIKKVAIKCKHCKSMINEERKVNQPNIPKPTNESSNTQFGNTDISTRSSSKNKKKLIVIVGFVSIVIIAGAISLFLNKNSQKIKKDNVVQSQAKPDTTKNETIPNMTSAKVTSIIDDKFYDSVFAEYAPVADKGNKVARYVCYSVCRAINDYKRIYDYEPPIEHIVKGAGKVYDDERKTYAAILDRAKKGNPFFQAVVSKCNSIGYGTEIDEREEINWQDKSAENNYILGVYIKGRSLLKAKKYTEGVELLKKAAVMGMGDAQFMLGYVYVGYGGIDTGIKPDYQLANSYLVAAIEKGSKEAKEEYELWRKELEANASNVPNSGNDSNKIAANTNKILVSNEGNTNKKTNDKQKVENSELKVVFPANKKTAWKEDGLKGKVKERVKIDYDIKNKFGKDVKDKISKTINKYDNNGNNIESERYNATGTLEIKSIYKYDDKGNMVERADYKADGVLDGKSIWKYDNMGNRIEEEYYGADGSSILKFIWKYDDKGNKIEEALYNNKGSLTSKSNSKYDDRGNQIESELHMNGDLYNKSIYKYDDKMNLIEDTACKPNGTLYSKSIYKYDDKGNRIEKTEYSADGALSKKSIWKYDDKGNKNEEAEYDKKGTILKNSTTAYTYY